MSAPLRKLRRRIDLELNDIEQIIARARSGWQEHSASGNHLLLDSVALSLHSFYSRVERIFKEIAKQLDRHLPTGIAWHKALLNQMTDEVSDIRPAVISVATSNCLDEYRRFRHLVRNIYNYYLSPDKIKPLIGSIQEVFEQFKQELRQFSAWLSTFE